ncbi:MAG TPA: DUF1801 domain-containing protein [Caulobacterales bacterium]|nr:DUF1801 domain-containing protein [Caulobacterales bacterium]
MLNAMDDLFRLDTTLRRDPAVEAWFSVVDPLRLLLRPWFERMRACGADVRETMHDHMPTACVGDAAFAYVNAFKAHAAVGFFNGATLADPARLLEGSGKRMRRVKLRPGAALDENALSALIAASYADIAGRA